MSKEGQELIGLAAKNLSMSLELKARLETCELKLAIAVEALEEIKLQKPLQDWPTDDDLRNANITASEALAKIKKLEE